VWVFLSLRGASLVAISTATPLVPVAPAVSATDLARFMPLTPLGVIKVVTFDTPYRYEENQAE